KKMDKGAIKMHIYEAEAIKKIDQQAVDQGCSLITLMENAGRNIFEAMGRYVKKTDSILILADTGNNGGDIMVLDRYLAAEAFDLQLAFPLGEPKSPTAKSHLEYAKAEGIHVQKEERFSERATILVDALLGIGVEPPLRKNAADVVKWANQQTARRFALDLPTGVAANHGAVSSHDSSLYSQAF